MISYHIDLGRFLMTVLGSWCLAFMSMDIALDIALYMTRLKYVTRFREY